MLFIFSTLVLIKHQWQLKTVVFLHWCLICIIPLLKTNRLTYSYSYSSDQSLTKKKSFIESSPDDLVPDDGNNPHALQRTSVT